LSDDEEIDVTIKCRTLNKSLPRNNKDCKTMGLTLMRLRACDFALETEDFEGAIVEAVVVVWVVVVACFACASLSFSLDACWEGAVVAAAAGFSVSVDAVAS
jgi:hypothetical protein